VSYTHLLTKVVKIRPPSPPALARHSPRGNSSPTERNNMIETPEEMDANATSVYGMCGSHEERVEVSLEFICGALLSIAQTLRDLAGTSS
jgi:hypothetical protein